MSIQEVKTLKNVFFINLKSRPDRKKHIQQQLSQLAWGYERFNAIQIQPVTPRNGTLSVAQSHLKVMKQAKERNLDYVIVLEDDFYVEELDFDVEIYRNDKISLNKIKRLNPQKIIISLTKP